MEKQNLRIVFMGTPEFAVETLKTLIEREYNVVGVITVPDKMAGRGLKMNESDVKVYAKSLGLPILQPEKMKDPDFISSLKSLNADIQVVVAFRMLPEVVWAMPKYGTFNLHGSLLPQYRGAAPINWAIINGETKTGVTTFFIDNQIDTGNIALHHEIDIDINDTAGDVHDKLMVKGAELVCKTIDYVIDNQLILKQQNQIPLHELKFAPKLFKENCMINWDNNAIEIHNFVRGLSPYPTAWTTLQSTDKQIYTKIFKTCLTDISHQLPTGRITIEKRRIFVSTKNGVLEILELQIAGKKRMSSSEFLQGFNIEGFLMK